MGARPGAQGVSEQQPAIGQRRDLDFHSKQTKLSQIKVPDLMRLGRVLDGLGPCRLLVYSSPVWFREVHLQHTRDR